MPQLNRPLALGASIFAASLALALLSPSVSSPSSVLVAVATPSPTVLITPGPPPSAGSEGCVSSSDAVAAISPCTGSPGTKIGIYILKTLTGAAPNLAEFHAEGSSKSGLKTYVNKTSVAGSSFSTVAPINLCDEPGKYRVILSANGKDLGAIGHFAIDCRGVITPAPSPPKGCGGYYFSFAPCSGPPGTTIQLFPLHAIAKEQAPKTLGFFQNPPGYSWFELDAPIGMGATTFTATVPSDLCTSPSKSATYNLSVDNYVEGQFIVTSCQGFALVAPTPSPQPTAASIPALASCNDLNTPAVYTPCSLTPGQTLTLWLRKAGDGANPYKGVLFSGTAGTLNQAVAIMSGADLVAAGKGQYTASVPTSVCPPVAAGSTVTLSLNLFATNFNEPSMGTLSVTCAPAPPTPKPAPTADPRLPLSVINQCGRSWNGTFWPPYAIIMQCSAPVGGSVTLVQLLWNPGHQLGTGESNATSVVFQKYVNYPAVAYSSQPVSLSLVSYPQGPAGAPWATYTFTVPRSLCTSGWASPFHVIVKDSFGLGGGDAGTLDITGC